MITARIAGCNTCDWREGPAEAHFRDVLFTLAKNHFVFSRRLHNVYVGVADAEISDLKDYSHMLDIDVETLPEPKLTAYGG